MLNRQRVQIMFNFFKKSSDLKKESNSYIKVTKSAAQRQHIYINAARAGIIAAADITAAAHIKSASIPRVESTAQLKVDYFYKVGANRISEIL